MLKKRFLTVLLAGFAFSGLAFSEGVPSSGSSTSVPSEPKGLEVSFAGFGEKVSFILKGKWRPVQEALEKDFYVISFVPLEENPLKFSKKTEFRAYRGVAANYGGNISLFASDAVKDFVEKCGSKSKVVNLPDMKVGQRVGASFAASCEGKGQSIHATTFFAGKDVYILKRFVMQEKNEAELVKWADSQD